MNQWGLTANASNQSQARENAHRAKWWQADYKWREFDGTNYDELKNYKTASKRNSFCISFSISLRPGYSFNYLMWN